MTVWGLNIFVIISNAAFWCPIRLTQSPKYSYFVVREQFKGSFPRVAYFDRGELQDRQ